MSTQPTDAEIDEIWRFEASKNWDSTLAMRTSYTRAVLARWGQPAHSGEPVAWKHDCAALLTNDVELWIDACPHCGKPRNAPQPSPAAQGDAQESEYRRGYRHGYEQRDAEVRGAMA